MAALVEPPRQTQDALMPGYDVMNGLAAATVMTAAVGALIVWLIGRTRR